jgi:hypothetical protein
MSDDYKSDYYGPECYVMKAENMQGVSLQLPKPNYNLVFLDAEGNEVGVLNFEGPGLSFEGVADLSAITFMDHVSKQFQSRLQQEYDRGFADGKAAK